MENLLVAILLLGTTLCSAFTFHQSLSTRNSRSFREKNGSNTNNDSLISFASLDVRLHEKVDTLIVGGGISGLSAAITIAKEASKNKNKSNTQQPKIVLLEAQSKLGGRVQSEITKDGFILDQGFAVFLNGYPQSKQIFDYEKLDLQKFSPGALIKIPSTTDLTCVADPLREPKYILDTLFTPVGTLADKLRLFPMFLNIKLKSIDDFFEEDEIDTLSCLRRRYGFSDKMVTEFFKPFLQGIFLCDLSQQSSHMFHFVMKMFIDGDATLPLGGMQAVTDQLVEKASDLGVDIRTNHLVTKFNMYDGDNDDDCIHTTIGTKAPQTTTVLGTDETNESKQTPSTCSISAKTVILATEHTTAKKLLSTVDDALSKVPNQPQKSIGCIYYSFSTQTPIQDPILVLNGEDNGVVNNVCFPSNVNSAYAPDGYGLCSVSILESTLQQYENDDGVDKVELDKAVRAQLGRWFPQHKDEIENEWTNVEIQIIPHAQSGQYSGPSPANVNGGRDAFSFQGIALPEGFLICGDHMATASLNGAIESGINAGKLAADRLATIRS